MEAQNVPVVFYGRVVDQDNAPLAGAIVRASIRSWHVVASSMGDAAFEKKQSISGSDGQFMVDGGQGDALTIEALEKEGYEPEPKTFRGFAYTTSDKFTPDPSNPVLLRMWKSDQKAQLVSSNKRCSLVPDGRVYTLDLLRGTLGESPTAEGDLRIAIKRAGDAAWGKHYDWSLEIQPVNGGLLEEVDPQSPMFLAPQEGYTNAYSLEVPATTPEWSYATGKKRFYLKTRNGQNFARVEIEAFAFYLQDNQARFNISYAVNPAGGRLLR
ncbi:MAG TPA: carboxypeptidase-like regulatory domain-containing protein [Bacillota bacterium]|nr:carboxypeptidase-like regulatory domain-containing protein [Bacillota bacterium]